MMKKTMFGFTAALAFGLAACLGACSEWNSFWHDVGEAIDDGVVDPLFNDRWFTSKDEDTIYYTVDYNTQGGTAIPSQTVAAGAGIILPGTSKKGHAHAGWKEQSAGTLYLSPFNQTTVTIVRDTTFVAQWAATSTGAGAGFTLSGTGWTYDRASRVYTIGDGADVTAAGATTIFRVVIASGAAATLTLDNASIVLSGDTTASPLDLAEGANLTLKLSGENTLTAAGGGAGVHVPEGRTLTITSAAGDGQTSGTLTATGSITMVSEDTSWSGAGIGGGDHEDGGNIRVSGGIVFATGGEFGAGVGGGWGSSSGGRAAACSTT